MNQEIQGIEAVVVDGPLQGEWIALHTPAERVPSHGTNYLGQRYAYDFIQLATGSNLPYRSGFWRHLLTAQLAESFLCWDEPVFSVSDGVVTAIGEGWPDRHRVNLPWALVRAALFPPSPVEGDFRPLAGNHVIVQGDAGAAFYAHLRADSLEVVVGQEVRAGDVLGRVGNSGNSTMPHLHFHMMDRPEIEQAAGVLCKFASYERMVEGRWITVRDGVPGALERIRWRTGPSPMGTRRGTEVDHT